MKRFVFILAMVLALTVSIAAQKSLDRSSASKAAMDESIVPMQMAFSVGGVETSKGTYSEINSKYWNNTYALNGTEDSITYHFTVSMDYPQEKPGANCSIEGGNWSLAVFKSGEYIGMIYGEVTSGNIVYISDKYGDGAMRFTTAKLLVKGGTDAFENLSDNINEEGFFTAFTDLNTKVPVVKASVALGF